MEKTIATNVTVVSVNHIDEKEAQKIAERNGFDNIGEYAESLEESVESLIAHRVFGDADQIPIIDVDTTVHNDWDKEDLHDVRTATEGSE